MAAITRAEDGGLEWNGPGTVQDWVVEMNRFDRDRQLDRAVLDKDIIQALADAVGGDAPGCRDHGRTRRL